MTTLLSIGEFSRATHLSVKALRHYDEVGLLRPADVDGSSGYRRYASGQIPSALLIRRFRDLDMPLEEIRVVLDAPDVEARDQAIVAHLTRMEGALERMQSTVASLRALLEGSTAELSVEYRTVDATPALVVRDQVDWDETERWLTGAFGELCAVVDATPGLRSGPDAALYSTEFFESHVGEVVAFIPISSESSGRGRVEYERIPGADLAVTVHEGAFSDIDQTYASLGAYIAERIVGTDGPIREHYLITADDTEDSAAHRTEVCWPIRRVS